MHTITHTHAHTALLTQPYKSSEQLQLLQTSSHQPKHGGPYLDWLGLDLQVLSIHKLNITFGGPYLHSAYASTFVVIVCLQGPPLEKLLLGINAWSINEVTEYVPVAHWRPQRHVINKVHALVGIFVLTQA